MKIKKVVVGLSGGVDSSVAAYLLKRKGYQVIGVFMKNWEEDDTIQHCSSYFDYKDAESVCKKLQIQFIPINFSVEYWTKVFKFFLNGYKKGKIPNPDVLCNKKIKFEVFLKFATKNLSADCIATGHYVRKKKNVDNSYQLLRGLDEKKDQSYFLHSLNQNQLKKSLFPLGNFKKSTVRKIAENINLPNAKKKDSSGICFIGKKKFRRFISLYIPENPGDIIDTKGMVLGKHKNSIYYTLGQREGLGVGGIKGKKKKPWYIIEKNTKKNTLTVDQNKNHPRLISQGCVLKKVHWINKILKQNNHLVCSVKVRYQQPDIPCIVKKEKNKTTVWFHQVVYSVSPGQSAVFYQNHICLGGGIIQQTF